MVGDTSHLSPLESQKRQLIASSDSNRARLCDEWQTMAHALHGLAHQANTIGAWASAAALLVTGGTAWRRRPPASGTASSWFKMILTRARVASTIWFLFRARGQKASPT